MRRDNQVAAAITGTFALSFAVPGAMLLYSVLFASDKFDIAWTGWAFPVLAIVVVGGIGIWTAMNRPAIGALWYLSWSVVALVPLVLNGWAPLLILSGLPAVTLFIASLFAWKASRQPPGSPKPATSRFGDDF